MDSIQKWFYSMVLLSCSVSESCLLFGKRRVNALVFLQWTHSQTRENKMKFLSVTQMKIFPISSKLYWVLLVTKVGQKHCKNIYQLESNFIAIPVSWRWKSKTSRQKSRGLISTQSPLVSANWRIGIIIWTLLRAKTTLTGYVYRYPINYIFAS